MLTPVEAFCDAIMHHEGWTPGSKSNRNRNPGNLRPLNDSQPTDGHGYRVFPTLVQGYQALLADVMAKFTGHTTTGLGPGSTIQGFFEVWAPAADGNNPDAYALDVCDWINRALSTRYTPQSQLAEVWPAAVMEA